MSEGQNIPEGVALHAARFGYPFPPMGGGADQGAPAGNADGGTGTENGSQGNALHESFISSAPEHLRDTARELVPIWDSYVQRQFTDHANYRKNWEPYEQLGVNELDPGELEELLNFREIVQDEDQFREWYNNVGELLGDNQGNPNDEGDAGDYDLPPELLQAIGSMQQQLNELSQERQMQAEQQALNQTAAEVRQELDQLKAQNSNLDWNEELEDTVCTLALKYDSPDALQRGFQDYQKLVGKAENGVFNNRTDPALRVAPVSGGNNNTSVEPVTTFEQAARAARERLHNTQ